MKKTLFTALVFAAAAHAEMKPDGTILADYCGHLTRSHEICISTVQGSDDLYIEKSIFTPAPNDGIAGVKKTFIKVEKVEDRSAVGANTTIYRGSIVTKVGKYDVQQPVELRVSQVVRPGAELKGTYSENGVPYLGIESSFTMHMMAHTLSN